MEEKELDLKYQARIRQIDARLKDLKEHQVMWARAGGVGNKMAMDAQKEIGTLMAEKERILSGRQQKIDDIKQVQQTLEALKKKASLLKKRSYAKEIKDIDKEIEELKAGRSK
jgi:hypothetical protein